MQENRVWVETLKSQLIWVRSGQKSHAGVKLLSCCAKPNTDAIHIFKKYVIYTQYEKHVFQCVLLETRTFVFFFFKITTEWIFQHGWCPATEYAFITFKGCAAPLTSHLMLSFSSMSGTAQPEKNNSILCLFKVLNDPDDVSSSRGPETQGSECSLTLHYSNCKIQWFCNYGPEIVTYQSPLRRFWPLFFKICLLWVLWRYESAALLE